MIQHHPQNVFNMQTTVCGMHVCNQAFPMHACKPIYFRYTCYIHNVYVAWMVHSLRKRSQIHACHMEHVMYINIVA